MGPLILDLGNFGGPGFTRSAFTLAEEVWSFRERELELGCSLIGAEAQEAIKQLVYNTSHIFHNCFPVIVENVEYIELFRNLFR